LGQACTVIAVHLVVFCQDRRTGQQHYQGWQPSSCGYTSSPFPRGGLGWGDRW
jgi:hypothetical protein